MKMCNNETQSSKKVKSHTKLKSLIYYRHYIKKQWMVLSLSIFINKEIYKEYICAEL